MKVAKRLIGSVFVKRQGLDKFLSELNKFYEIVIFSNEEMEVLGFVIIEILILRIVNQADPIEAGSE